MKNENIISKHAISIVLTLFIVGFIIVVLFTLISPFNDWSFNSNSDLFAKYGTFVGGVVGPILSFASILLLYKTLISQQQSIEKQDIAFQLQQSNIEKVSFENTFFNLLKTQQELTLNIKSYFNYLELDFSKGVYTIEGKEFFANSKNELAFIWSSLNSHSYMGMNQDDEESIYLLNEQILKCYDPSNPEKEPDHIAEEIEKKIRNNELIRYKNRIYNITEKQWTEISVLGVEDKIEKTYSIFFQKYHYAIGHYFRHLYHIIKFVKDFKPKYGIDKNINKKYIDFIQAQMSSFEMMLLFYNSISFSKLQTLLIEFNFLENLAEEDLIVTTHNCIDGIVLKKRKDLL